MTHPNLDLIDRFFEAYGRHDLQALRGVAFAAQNLPPLRAGRAQRSAVLRRRILPGDWRISDTPYVVQQTGLNLRYYVKT